MVGDTDTAIVESIHEHSAFINTESQKYTSTCIYRISQVRNLAKILTNLPLITLKFLGIFINYK